MQHPVPLALFAARLDRALPILSHAAARDAFAGVERWRRQSVVAAHLFIVYHHVVAYFPDKIIGGQRAEPRFQHIADAESLVLSA